MSKGKKSREADHLETHGMARGKSGKKESSRSQRLYHNGGRREKGRVAKNAGHPGHVGGGGSGHSGYSELNKRGGETEEIENDDHKKKGNGGG